MIVLLALLCSVVSVYGQSACGQGPISSTPNYAHQYIVGGQLASEGDIPWQVGLVNNGYLICGGIYIVGSDGNPVVITAAHCLGSKNPRPQDYSVVFGMHQTNVAGSRQVVGASSITVHSGYNSNSMTNDIAVIKFSATGHAAIGTTWSSPACMPSRTYNDGEDSLVSGWGTTSEGGSSSSTLRYVWKPLLSLAKCEQTGNAGNLDSTMLCAGEAGKDACQGDSGGPLVCNRNGNWELVGVVSWGFGCGRDNYPGVYADAFALRSWINSNK